MLGLCYDSGKGAELFICKAEEAEGVDTKEIAMRWLSENLNYVDSVTVIDSTGRIIAKQRFNHAIRMKRIWLIISGRWARTCWSSSPL